MVGRMISWLDIREALQSILLTSLPPHVTLLIFYNQICFYCFACARLLPYYLLARARGINTGTTSIATLRNANCIATYVTHRTRCTMALFTAAALASTSLHYRWHRHGVIFVFRIVECCCNWRWEKLHEWFSLFLVWCGRIMIICNKWMLDGGNYTLCIQWIYITAIKWIESKITRASSAIHWKLLVDCVYVVYINEHVRATTHFLRLLWRPK